MNKNRGFTLIELAAVMIIISLVVTLTIKSTNLLGNTKLDSIMADVRFYAKQSDRFEEMYGGLAGDFANYASLPSYNTSPSASAGNGNGIIDDSLIDESLQYWLHLQKAGLVDGYFDGSSSHTAFDPAQSSIAGGYPLLRYPGAIITVANDASAGLVYSVSGVSTSNYTTALLTPINAYNLDKKYDDGNPDTGIIRAFDGSNVSEGQCRSTNSYNLSYNDESCYLKFYIDNKKASSSATTPYSYGSCDFYNFGSTRISTTATCPLGYDGYYYENCTSSGWASGLDNYCQPVSCGTNITMGQKIYLPCAPGFYSSTSKASVEYTCTEYGILQHSSTSQCSSSYTNTSCNYDYVNNLSCPIGYSGIFNQSCSSGSSTSNFDSSCSAITCVGTSLGSSVINNVNSPCPTGWTQIASATSACALPITNISNGSYLADGQAILVQTYCAADYGACVGNGTRFGTSCPFGQSGTYIQVCNGSKYVTTVNTCAPVTCGNEPVGSWRTANDQKCPNGMIGSVLEVCMYTDSDIATCSEGCANAKWMRSYVGCN